MNTQEARTLLAEELASWRARSYPQLVGDMKKPTAFEVVGASGATYQIEIDVVWDDRPGGNLRVIGSIDDAAVRAFAPVADDFIVAPDGTFVGE